MSKIIMESQPGNQCRHGDVDLDQEEAHARIWLEGDHDRSMEGHLKATPA